MTCVGFSHDDSLLATGDMSGVIKVWKVDLREEIWSSEVGDLEVKTRNMPLRVSAVNCNTVVPRLVAINRGHPL